MYMKTYISKHTYMYVFFHFFLKEGCAVRPREKEEEGAWGEQEEEWARRQQEEEEIDLDEIQLMVDAALGDRRESARGGGGGGGGGGGRILHGISTLQSLLTWRARVCQSLASLSQVRHQRVAISLHHLHKEICGAIERDMTVFGTITSGMTTGVGDVGDSLLRHARYLHSLLAQSVEPIMVAPLAACSSEVMRAVCLVAEAMCTRVVHTTDDVNIQCAGALVHPLSCARCETNFMCRCIFYVMIFT